MCSDTASPEFAVTVLLPKFVLRKGGKNIILKFVAFDQDSSNRENLKDQEYLGECETLLCNVFNVMYCKTL